MRLHSHSLSASPSRRRGRPRGRHRTGGCTPVRSGSIAPCSRRTSGILPTGMGLRLSAALESSSPLRGRFVRRGRTTHNHSLMPTPPPLYVQMLSSFREFLLRSTRVPGGAAERGVLRERHRVAGLGVLKPVGILPEFHRNRSGLECDALVTQLELLRGIRHLVSGLAADCFDARRTTSRLMQRREPFMFECEIAHLPLWF